MSDEVDEVEAAGLQPMYAYPRATVDEFVRASEVEKQRLRTSIEEDEHRARRARAAIGMHHMMVSMLIETQRDLEELRRDAERVAAQIIATASEGTRSPWPAPSGGSAPSPGMPDGRGSPMSIDLVAEGNLDERREPVRSPFDVAPDGLAPNGHHTDDSDDASNEYFAFLREALDDDEPLGPRNPVGAAE
jgi:hypothetical protein